MQVTGLVSSDGPLYFDILSLACQTITFSHRPFIIIVIAGVFSGGVQFGLGQRWLV